MMVVVLCFILMFQFDCVLVTWFLCLKCIDAQLHGSDVCLESASKPGTKHISSSFDAV
jgi:hypothetical protein